MISIEEIKRRGYRIIEEWNKKNNKIHEKESVFPHLIEEIGELAREIGHQKSNWRQEFNKEKFDEELIDVLMQVLHLATDYNVDIEKAYNKKILKLKERYGFDYQEEIKREFVSTVYLVKDARILLTLNEKINKWVPIGGHVEENELPHETAIREAKEESGFDIELINLTNMGNINQNFGINLDVIKPDHHHINISYLAKIKSGELKSEITDDNTPLKWFSQEELRNLEDIPENVKASGIKAIELLNNINL